MNWAIEKAARAHGIPAEMVRRPGKGCRAVTDARMDAALAMEREGMSLPQIGRALGAKHHTSVRYLLARARRKAYGDAPSSIPVPDESGVWAI